MGDRTRLPRRAVGPIAVQLPKLSVTAVAAGQVLVDAETVHFSALRVRS